MRNSNKSAVQEAETPRHASTGVSDDPPLPSAAAEPVFEPGAHLVGVDLSGRDLSGVDLRGANLAEADLRGTKLLGANLAEASLFRADLERAHLLGANLRDADLTEAKAHAVILGSADLTGATLFAADLSEATLTEAVLCDADARSTNFSDCRLRGADLRGAEMRASVLTDADLSGAAVHGADFAEASLVRAHMRNVTGFSEAHWVGADISGMDFTSAYTLRRFVMDQNYLFEFRHASRANALIYRVWSITSDCGRSLGRWAVLTATMAVLFGAAYTQVALDYGDHRTALSPFYFSVVTLTTLGYGDVLPASLVAQVVVLAEVVVGYIMLGGLLSIFATKMGRRAE